MAIGTPLLKFTVNQAKSYFFDSDVVLAVEAGQRKALSKIGAFIRKSSRQSIRNPGKKRRYSKPGQPPYNQTGLLKEFILFTYDPVNHSVVIGPARLKSKIKIISNRGTIPELLEEGGTEERYFFKGAKSGTGIAPLAVPGVLAKRPNAVYRKTITIAPRPYMGPALEKETTNERLKDAWENVIKPVTSRSAA